MPAPRHHHARPSPSLPLRAADDRATRRQQRTASAGHWRGEERLTSTATSNGASLSSRSSRRVRCSDAVRDRGLDTEEPPAPVPSGTRAKRGMWLPNPTPAKRNGRVYPAALVPPPDEMRFDPDADSRATLRARMTIPMMMHVPSFCHDSPIQRLQLAVSCRVVLLGGCGKSRVTRSRPLPAALRAAPSLREARARLEP